MKTKSSAKINTGKIKPKTFVSIHRHQNLCVLNGAFLKESKNWVLIQNIEDFRIDGYSLIHKMLIQKVRHSSGDKFYQSILIKEGIAKKIKDLPKLEIEDIGQSLLYLQKRKSPVIIECDLLGTWPFSIGFVKAVRENDFDLWYFDPEGKPEKKPRKIKFAHIERIGIKERYSEIFGKYVKK